VTARRTGCAFALAIAVALALPRVAAADGPLEIAATTWLELLDEGRFADAWRESAPQLRDGTTAQAWTEATHKVRVDFGAVKSRNFVGKDYHRQLEGEPDGNYFTLRSQTTLADGTTRLEIVTLTAGADGQYRAAAYGIKR
jgi:Protein of unknown function (DUF4019)